MGAHLESHYGLLFFGVRTVPSPECVQARQKLPRRCPECGGFMAVSDDRDYGKCYPCSLVQAHDIIDITPR